MKLKFWGRSAVPAPTYGAPSGAALAEPAQKKKRSLLGGRSVFGMFKSSEVSATDRWTATPMSPDAIINRRQMALVARSREQWSNNDFVRAFIRLIRQNVVGPHGIAMQAKVTKPRGAPDKDANAAIEAEWRDWGRKGNCDVTGELSWRELQCLVVETTARDGEFFARIIIGKDAGPHGFALQLIDPQRLPVWYENYQRTDGGGFIRHGIEFNSYGRPVAYHFASTDEWDAYYYTYSGQGFVRIPAEEIIHGFIHEMVGQRRGLPWASTSLFSLHHQEGFQDAAVQNARAGATKMGFIQYREGFGPEMEDDEPVTVDAEPLHFQELPEGAEFKEFAPQYPNGEFAVFNKAMLRRAASGMGVPYNELANDLEGVNFSSIRQLTLDAREHYKEIQQWMIETLAAPVFARWMKWKLLRGDIKVKGVPLAADKLELYSQVAWQARRWQWIDPKSDVTASVTAIRAGLTSPSQIIREQGRDPEQVFAEIAEDIKLMRAAGIDEDFVSVMFGLLPAPEPTPNKGDESAAKEPAK
jgi:lambda family phage portal protein